MHPLNSCKIFRSNSLSRMEMNYFPKFFFGEFFALQSRVSGGESRVEGQGLTSAAHLSRASQTLSFVRHANLSRLLGTIATSRKTLLTGLLAQRFAPKRLVFMAIA